MTEANSQIVYYISELVGKVRVTYPEFIALRNTPLTDEKKWIIAGICKNSYLKKEEPPIITSEFLHSQYKALSYPKNSSQKGMHFLKYMYDNGGKAFQPIALFNPYSEFTLCYAVNAKEMIGIIDGLITKNYISATKKEMSAGRSCYLQMTMTQEGIEFIENELPDTQMNSLINSITSTGDIEIDQKINHAMELFLSKPTSIEKLRSACEALSYILEPLRKELTLYFSSKDTNDFFNIVNQFDIRHNKDFTKTIEYPEQLEWIFYTLLNSINTYCKLKRNNNN